jgi:hypothetical protein
MKKWTGKAQTWGKNRSSTLGTAAFKTLRQFNVFRFLVTWLGHAVGHKEKKKKL